MYDFQMSTMMKKKFQSTHVKILTASNKIVGIKVGIKHFHGVHVLEDVWTYNLMVKVNLLSKLVV
jgi:hypothetical protein